MYKGHQTAIHFRQKYALKLDITNMLAFTAFVLFFTRTACNGPFIYVRKPGCVCMSTVPGSRSQGLSRPMGIQGARRSPGREGVLSILPLTFSCPSSFLPKARISSLTKNSSAEMFSHCLRATAIALHHLLTAPAARGHWAGLPTSLSQRV